MIRAAQVVQFLETRRDLHQYAGPDSQVAEAVMALYSMNLTNGDVQNYRVDDEAIDMFDNNNGVCLVDITAEGDFSFGFLHPSVNGGDFNTVISAAEYYLYETSELFDPTEEVDKKMAEGPTADSLVDAKKDPALHAALSTLLRVEQATPPAEGAPAYRMTQETADALRPADANPLKTINQPA